MYSFNCNNFYSIRCSSVNIIRLILDGDIMTILSDNLKLVSINRYQVSNIAIHPICLIADTSIGLSKTSFEQVFSKPHIQIRVHAWYMCFVQIDKQYANS